MECLLIFGLNLLAFEFVLTFKFEWAAICERELILVCVELPDIEIASLICLSYSSPHVVSRKR